MFPQVADSVSKKKNPIDRTIFPDTISATSTMFFPPTSSSHRRRHTVVVDVGQRRRKKEREIEPSPITPLFLNRGHP